MKENIYAGHNFIYDADLSKYFDTIPHGKLFKLLKHRVTDGGLLGLLQQEKTQLLHLNKSSLFFLGFEFRSIPSKFAWNHRNYTNIRPSIQSRSKLFSLLKELFRKRKHWTVWKLNPVLRGWLNYFSIGKVSHIWDTIRVIKQHLSYKLYKWMKGKGRKAHRKLRQRPYENLVKFYGLLDLDEYARLNTLSNAG